jgi:hypothetical protein
MIKYIFFNSYEKLPKEEEVLTFSYDKSFANDDHSGSYFYYKDEKTPTSFRLYWPKWRENKIPEYTRAAFVNVIFPPLHKRDIRYSKKAAKKGRSSKYKYCATVFIGNAKHQIFRNVAFIDLCIFHRAVFLFAKSLEGVIWDTKNKKVISSDDYYRKYKKFIESKFSRKLSKKDLKKMKAVL